MDVCMELSDHAVRIILMCLWGLLPLHIMGLLILPEEYKDMGKISMGFWLLVAIMFSWTTYGATVSPESCSYIIKP